MARHFLDLAAVGVTLFPLGYLLQALGWGPIRGRLTNAGVRQRPVVARLAGGSLQGGMKRFPLGVAPGPWGRDSIRSPRMPQQMELIYVFWRLCLLAFVSFWRCRLTQDAGRAERRTGGPMVQPYDADFWRQRAKEARALAKSITLPVARRELEQIAAAYARLADRAERTAPRRARPPGA